MKSKRYIITTVILLFILGIFMTLGIVNSRREMMNLIKEEARSFLLIVASTQENSIFAEGKYEDEIIDKLIGICDYLETTSLNIATLNRISRSFQLNSISIFDIQTTKLIMSSGNPLRLMNNAFGAREKIIYDYFDVGQKKNLRFIYKTQNRLYHIEVSAEEIQRFRQEFGINKIITQLTLNPMIKYLVLQDKKGIIFATPNVQTITKIEDDSVLVRAYEERNETSRIADFEDVSILELVRPFTVGGQTYGLFRIGISLDSYYRHVRSTERQLIMLFVIMLGAGLVLLYFFSKYQSYMDLRELFDKTLGAVEDGILMVDRNGLVIGINNAFARLSNFDEKMLLNHDYLTLFKDDPFNIMQVLEKGTKVIDEKNIFQRNILYSTYPLLDTKKKINGAISVLRDVTELRIFEKEREDTERLKFLGNLVANFAHEIRNPLNGLSIAAQRLMKEFKHDNEEYQRLVTTIKQEIDALSKVLNDFLSLARPRMKENKEFNLSSVVQTTLTLIGEQAKDSGIELKYNIRQNIKMVGDIDDFKRAVLNIFINSIEALNQVKDREKMITVDLDQAHNVIHFRVSDNGKGMDKQELKRIFTPYYTTKKKGTGLGLYIAQKIIKDHNGIIEVKSEQDKGTVFHIKLQQ